MTKRSNIVSFEDARRSSRHASDEWAMYGSSPAKTNRAKASRQAGKNSSASKSSRPTTAPARRSSRSDRQMPKDERAPRTTRTGQTSRSAERVADSRSTQKTSRNAAQSRAAESDARDIKRRKKAKARAEKQYERQYASAPKAEEAAEGAPRAALYKGKMGSSQRKSTRMQRASQAGPVSAKLNPAGWFSHLNLSSRTAKLVTAAICAVFVCAFLYTPMQQYYQAVRDNARLEAEYAAVSSRNTALDEHNDSLASDAGLEDAVRQKYGYIVAGEQTAIVTGLSDEVELSKKENAQVEANILASSIKAPEEWYTPILDAVFGVE